MHDLIKQHRETTFPLLKSKGDECERIWLYGAWYCG